MKSALKSLAELILQNVDVLEASLKKRGANVPSLDEPAIPGPDVTNGDPELMATNDITCRGAWQILNILRPPQLTLLQDAVSVRTHVFIIA